MTAVVMVTNPTSNVIGLIVKGRTFNIPAHRFEGNPVKLTVRDDCVDALIRSIRKRPALRAEVVEADSNIPKGAEADADTPSPGPATTPPSGSSDESDTGGPPDRSVFFGECKATKAGEKLWTVTVPGGQVMTIEADHHKRAKEMAYEMLFGTGDTGADEGSDK